MITRIVYALVYILAPETVFRTHKEGENVLGRCAIGTFVISLQYRKVIEVVVCQGVADKKKQAYL